MTPVFSCTYFYGDKTYPSSLEWTMHMHRLHRMMQLREGDREGDLG